MGKQKRQPTLTGRITAVVMVMIIISTIVIGFTSYRLHVNQIMASRGQEAQNVAMAMAARIDGDKFTEIMDSMEKNDYWYEVQAYAEDVGRAFNVQFLYIIDNDYDDNVTYFAEGALDDVPFELGATEELDVYADEMFATISSGIPSRTEPYSSGEYGDMVSGFAAIFDSSGNVAGVVGADFPFNDLKAEALSFGFTIFGIVAVLLLACYIFALLGGKKLVGKPLTALDEAAQRLSYGDMDIYLTSHSRSEIGRLTESFTRMIEGMREQIDALEQISRGDLTVQIVPRGEKDIMGHAVVQILNNLNGMFNEINRSTAQVSYGAKQIASGAQALAQGATEQASAVEELSASINEVSEKTRQNAEMAKRAALLGNTIEDNAEKGSQQMDHMMTAAAEINEASQNISRVIKVIDDIAFQTNILALNAAVEAARAGQHGKGFAVVAEEVRSLAAKSAAAARDTGSLIANSIEKAELGARIAGETAASLAEIVAGIQESGQIVGDIARASEEQASSISQIDRGIEQVTQVVQQNSATAEQSAAASEEMSGQSAVLHDLIDRFKIQGDHLYLGDGR